MTHMNSAVAAHMIPNYQENRNHLEKSMKGSGRFTYGVDSAMADVQGNQLFIDADSLFADSEAIRSRSAVDNDHELRTAKPDSSCVRPEIPSTVLLNYLRNMAVHRHRQELKNYSKEGVNEEDHCPQSLAFAFSSTALVALGVLVEELTRECMVSWEERNDLDRNKLGKRLDTSKENVDRERKDKELKSSIGPLSVLSERTLQIEARLQLQGASFKNSEEDPPVTATILRNRLEVTFVFML